MDEHLIAGIIQGAAVAFLCIAAWAIVAMALHG